MSGEKGQTRSNNEIQTTQRAPNNRNNKHPALWRPMGNWYTVEMLPLPAWCDIPVAFSTRTPGTEIWGCQCCVSKHLLPIYCAQLAVISSGVHPATVAMQNEKQRLRDHSSHFNFVKNAHLMAQWPQFKVAPLNRATSTFDAASDTSASC